MVFNRGWQGPTPFFKAQAMDHQGGEKANRRTRHAGGPRNRATTLEADRGIPEPGKVHRPRG
eukprot:5104713-Alexandrium_andersonii.AAC.1